MTVVRKLAGANIASALPLLCCLSCSYLNAQEPQTAGIQGIVRENNGMIVEHALVTATSPASTAYIPVDHIPGPRPCTNYTFEDHRQIPMLYKGDAFRGTYRTNQSILLFTDARGVSDFLPNTGPTRNYGFDSPTTGNTLSSYPLTSDIYYGPYFGADEDGIPDDCYHWNKSGKAETGFMQDYGVQFPGFPNVIVNLHGLGQDPLEPRIGGIQWDMNVEITNNSAVVHYDHTCYPAHQVKVNGTVVYSYLPSHNNTAYLVGCLTNLLPRVVGETLVPTLVPAN